MTTRPAAPLSAALALTLLAGCLGGASPGPGAMSPTGGTGGSTGGSTPSPTGGTGGSGGSSTTPMPGAGTAVTVALTTEQQQEVDRLTALLAETKSLTAEQLLSSRKVPFRTSLGYDPGKAVNLPLIQASALKLDAAELGALGSRGFVVSDKRRYPHFAYGYETIYSQDLPVFISADSILQAVHQSYDDILKALEITALSPELQKLLMGMRARLGADAGLEAVTRKDADLFLGVGLSLLQGTPAAAVAGSTAADIKKLVDMATAAQGSADMVLFGSKRQIDFSQFKPRGHYTDDPRLEKYFRAMMWLGRIDFPFLQTDPDTGKPVLIRRSVAAALALRSLMDAEGMARWGRLDRTVRAFVGEPDSMAPPEVDRLKTDLGLAADASTLGDVSDDKLAAAIVKGAYGKQKILSQIVIQAPHAGTWPLDATFLFFGQRYVFDSHVFSNVVYDRHNPVGVPMRMMPSALDAAYAALANDQAAQLLAPELQKYKHAPALESMRRLGDEHGAAFWDANLYNLWLGALRALSPGADIGKTDSGLPSVAATEAWGRRLLSTQLASWAQLRHDTILYAKQSYTSGVACEFPDAYVDPYPAFFAQLEKFAAAGVALAADLPLDPADYLAKNIPTYFATLKKVSGTLREMAEHQRTGMPHKPEHLAFINEAVKLQRGCGGPAGITGWYGQLFFSPGGAAAFDPTIADVHTQPTDETGNPVGHVLHVGTGYARLMVLTVETCMGPRAYAGVVSSYHEEITQKLERLNDLDWAKRFQNGQAPADVPWLQDLIVK